MDTKKINTEGFLESYKVNIFNLIRANSEVKDIFLKKIKELNLGDEDLRKIGLNKKSDSSDLEFENNLITLDAFLRVHKYEIEEEKAILINDKLFEFYKEINNNPDIDNKIKENIESFLSKFGSEGIKLEFQTELEKKDIGPLLTQLQDLMDSNLKKKFFRQISSERPTDDLCEKLGMEIKDSDSEVLFNSGSIKLDSITKSDLEDFKKILLKFYVVMDHDSENKDGITKTVGDYILKYGNDEEKTEVIISRNEEIKEIIEKNKFFKGKKKENESYVELIKRIKEENIKDKNKGDDKSKRTVDKYGIYIDKEFEVVFEDLKNLIDRKGKGILKGNIFDRTNDAKEYFKAIVTAYNLHAIDVTKKPPTPTTDTSDPTAKSTTSTDGAPPVDLGAGTSIISPVINSSANFGNKPTPSKKFGGKGKSSSQPLNNNQVHFGGALKKSPLNFGVKLTNPRNPFGTGTSSSGGPFGFVDLDNELPDALNKLYDLYIDFALAKSQPYNVYLYNKEHILAKQTELVNNIYAYCKSSGTNIGNQLVNLSNTLQSTSKINNEDLNVIIESIKENDFVKIYDALSHICMDGARDRVQNFITNGKSGKIGTGDTELLDPQNINQTSFDKGFSEHKEETLANLAATCGKIIGNNNNFNSNDLNQLQNFKNETGIDYKRYPDVINHLARAGRVAENNLSNKNLTTNCADAWKGVPYSEASDNYVECVKNYNQYIMFDNIGHISFEINGCTLKLNLTDEQKNKFDMLELGKYTGRSIGLVPGIVGYLSSHPEIGIDVNNINKCISISKNGRELTTQEEKNNVIMKEFVSDGFKSKISNVNFNQSLDSAASSLESRVISRDKSTAGKMLLSCFGENNQTVSPKFVYTIKAQTQTITQTRANTEERGIGI